jgi:RNA polymerase sigma factor (sigma-70 family)
MTDEQAMTAVMQGDLDKSAILYERYKKPLLNFFLYHCIDTRNTQRDDARDLVQQVFLRLLKYRHSYREGAMFKAWIYEISRNVLYDYSKKKIFNIGIENMPDIADDDGDTEDQYQNIHRALAQLSEQSREVLVLSRFQNMSYEEVGQVLGITVANVKVRVFRAIQQLRDVYFAIDKQ